jgi:hypothetical protein
MKTFFDGRREYPDCGHFHFHFDEFENETNKLLFAHGIYAGYNLDALPPGFENTIYLEAEEPNGYVAGCIPTRRERGLKLDMWTKVLSNDPYSANWLNKEVYGIDKFVPIAYPVNIRYLCADEPKIYDVFYQGGIHSHYFSQLVSEISKFNYRFCTLQAGNELATDYCLPWQEKMKRNAQCKISVCIDMLMDLDRYIPAIKSIDKWQLNPSFAYIDYGIMPQFKYRAVEAGFSKSLLLVLRDPWNVIEHWFKPDEHFIYFNSIETVGETIKECLNDWNYCQKIVDNMYNEVMQNHTTLSFYKNFLEPYDV